MKIETIAVHGGFEPDPTTKAVAVPIYHAGDRVMTITLSLSTERTYHL